MISKPQQKKTFSGERKRAVKSGHVEQTSVQESKPVTEMRPEPVISAEPLKTPAPPVAKPLKVGRVLSSSVGKAERS